MGFLKKMNFFKKNFGKALNSLFYRKNSEKPFAGRCHGGKGGTAKVKSKGAGVKSLRKNPQANCQQ